MTDFLPFRTSRHHGPADGPRAARPEYELRPVQPPVPAVRPRSVVQIRVDGRWIAGETVADGHQVDGQGVLVTHHGHLLWVDPADVRLPADAGEGRADTADTADGIEAGPAAASAELWADRRQGFDAGIAAEFARMAVELHDEPGVEETIEKVLEFALRAVACDSASVLLVHKGGKVEVAAATDGLATAACEAQIECGEGPGLTVLDQPTGLLVRDLALEQRWPGWTSRVKELGVRSVLSVRLFVGGSTLGALDLYDAEPDRFDADDEAVAQILGRHASVALSQARQESTLWQAIDARKLVGQAQGLLMERFDLDADQAFAVLRRYSQDNNVKLREVARRLVDTRRLPAKE